MTSIQTADGRLLRPRPTGTPIGGAAGGMPTWFPPMWSDGERYPNGLTDSFDGPLASFSHIYRSQPVLAGVIDMMAFRASTLPFSAFTPDPNGARTPVGRSDSLATLLRRPRPRTSTVHLLNHIFTSLFVHGNALVAKLRAPGTADEPPYMLWPLDWSHISAYADPGSDIELWSTTQFGPDEAYIYAEDTIHFAWPGEDGGQIGVSPLEKLGVTIRLEDAAQRYQTANFRNGNRPSNAITFAGQLKREQLDHNRAVLESFHKGVDRAGKTLMLTGDAKVQTLSMTAVEASLIEQRHLDREEIAIVFGLSGPSLTDSTNSALGNVAERFRAFYRDVLPPWTTLVVETFEAQLLDPEPGWMDRLVRFDFTDKLRGEPREQAEKLKLEVEAGLRSRNEGRRELGLPPKGDPDDENNPANQLTGNLNNQAPISRMNDLPAGAEPSGAPDRPVPPAPGRSQT